MKVARNEKRKKLLGFSFYINIGNFEGFLRKLNLSAKHLFWRCVLLQWVEIDDCLPLLAWLVIRLYFPNKNGLHQCLIADFLTQIQTIDNNSRFEDLSIWFPCQYYLAWIFFLSHLGRVFKWHPKLFSKMPQLFCFDFYYTCYINSMIKLASLNVVNFFTYSSMPELYSFE